MALQNGGAITKGSGPSSTITPQRAIRRFDVFAEYNRLKGHDKGMDDPHAKGYGLWLAKVVASGGGRRISSQSDHHEPSPGTEEQSGQQAAHAGHEKHEWHELSGEPQTDTLFDREIVQRMGRDFYARVFAPAIAQAVDQGRTYESIRDTIRRDWKPRR